MKDWFSKGDTTMKDVIEDIKTLQIDSDRTSGLNPDNIDEFNKQKALFFSENIINLERKDYSALAAKQSVEREFGFVRGIGSLLQDHEYQQLLNWNIPKPISLPDEKTLSEICRYSYVKRFLVREIGFLNKLLEVALQDVEILRSIESGSFVQDPYYKEMKEKLVHQQLPESWVQLTQIHNLQFKQWRELVKLRHYCLSKQATSLDKESRIFNLKWFVNPKGLLEAIMLDAAYRRAPSTKFDDIIMTFKPTNIFERNQEQLSEEEFYVFGLKVKNASMECLKYLAVVWDNFWENAYVDKIKSELSDKMEVNCTDEFPAVLVQCKYAKRAGNEKVDSKGYLCPVVSAYESTGLQVVEQNVLFKVIPEGFQDELDFDPNLYMPFNGAYGGVTIGGGPVEGNGAFGVQARQGQILSGMIVSADGKDIRIQKVVAPAKSAQTEFECSICRLEGDKSENDSSYMECQHSYHFSCVSEWLLRHSTCPMCKKQAGIIFRTVKVEE